MRVRTTKLWADFQRVSRKFFHHGATFRASLKSADAKRAFLKFLADHRAVVEDPIEAGEALRESRQLLKAKIPELDKLSQSRHVDRQERGQRDK